MLHCVRQSNTVGGDNVFSDGFHVAHQLSREQPHHYKALTNIPVDFYDVGKEDFEFHLRTRKPIVR